MFSFHRFLEKLKFKCENTNTKLYIVTEEYTSKTCTFCGVINNVGSSEIYKCKECKSVIDRDVNASRNILIKNLKPCLR
jgi:transposase